MKDKNYMIISIDEKKIWQNSSPFEDKNAQQTRNKLHVRLYMKTHD